MAIVFGFVYNSEASNGVDDFRNSVQEIQNNFNDAASMVGKIDYIEICTVLSVVSED